MKNWQQDLTTIDPVLLECIEASNYYGLTLFSTAEGFWYANFSLNFLKVPENTQNLLLEQLQIGLQPRQKDQLNQCQK